MEIKAGSIAQVAGNRLALRREMAVNAKNLIRRLDTGTNVKVISVPNAEWCEVEVGNNRGYVMSKFLQPTASAPVDIGDANKISNKPHTIHISCESKEEADRVLQLLKTAAIS